MAKKSKRTMSARISLTNEAYKKVSAAAFKNCRTVSQELTYMVERQTIAHEPIQRYDSTPADDQNFPFDAIPPAPHQDMRGQTNDPNQASQGQTNDPTWTLAQEDQIVIIGKERGLSDAQILAVKFMNRTFEATREAILAEPSVAA